MAEGRDAFLGRVRASLRTGGPAVAAVARTRPTPIRDEGDGVEVFCALALESGADLSRVATRQELRAGLLEVVEQLGARRLVRARAPLLDELGLDAELGARGVGLRVCDLRLPEGSRAALRAESALADVGLSQADHGLAETGTLVFRHRPGQGRALSVLPPTHLAVVRAADVVANLEVLLCRPPIAGSDLGSALTFVTGPSRTADIEMVITTGVHGPGRLHVFVLDEVDSGAGRRVT